MEYTHYYLIGNTSSKGPFSIAMLDYRSVSIFVIHDEFMPAGYLPPIQKKNTALFCRREPSYLLTDKICKGNPPKKNLQFMDRRTVFESPFSRTNLFFSTTPLDPLTRVSLFSLLKYPSMRRQICGQRIQKISTNFKATIAQTWPNPSENATAIGIDESRYLGKLRASTIQNNSRFRPQRKYTRPKLTSQWTN